MHGNCVLLAAVVVPLLFSGCSAQVPPMVQSKAQELCRDHGGIQQVQTNFVSSRDGALVDCKDGTFIEYRWPAS